MFPVSFAMKECDPMKNSAQLYALKCKAASLHVRVLSNKGDVGLRGKLAALVSKINQLESVR